MTTEVLLVGGGRVGRHVAEQLGSEYIVTIIERDPAKATSVDVHRWVEGDGTDPETFDAGLSPAVEIVGGVTNDTETNLEICRMAKETREEVRTILRIARDGEQDHGYRNFVDHTVYPAAAGAMATTDVIAAR